MKNDPWRPALERHIRELQRERFSKSHQASTVEAWTLAIQAIADGVPLSRRTAADTFGWGTTRAANLLQELTEFLRDNPRVAPLSRQQERPQTRQPTQVESQESDDDAPQTRHKRATSAPPSRARDPLLRSENEIEKEQGALAPAAVAAPPPPPRKVKDKPPEDPRLRLTTDIWVEVLREEGVLRPGEPSGLRMLPGPSGVDRKAREAVVAVSGLQVVNGHDRTETLRGMIRAFVRLSRARDDALFPRDGAIAFDRLPKAWPSLQAAVRKDPNLARPKGEEVFDDRPF